MEQPCSHSVFIKFHIGVFFENLWRKFKFHLNLTRITGTLHKDPYTLKIIPRSFLLRVRNVSDKVAEKIKTHFLCKIFFSPLKIVPFIR